MFLFLPLTLCAYVILCTLYNGLPCGSAGKESPAMQETCVSHSLGWKDPLEKGKATHSSVLAWRFPCTV